MRGLILLAHGARDPNWARPFEDLARRVRELCPDQRVVNAYLDFIAPDLGGAGRALAAQGCTEIEVLPLFLGAGGHVRKDVPVLLQALQIDCPGVTWTLRPAVGESPILLAAMARIAAEAQP